MNLAASIRGFACPSIDYFAEEAPGDAYTIKRNMVRGRQMARTMQRTAKELELDTATSIQQTVGDTIQTAVTVHYTPEKESLQDQRFVDVSATEDNLEKLLGQAALEVNQPRRILDQARIQNDQNRRSTLLLPYSVGSKDETGMYEINILNVTPTQSPPTQSYHDDQSFTLSHDDTMPRIGEQLSAGRRAYRHTFDDQPKITYHS